MDWGGGANPFGPRCRLFNIGPKAEFWAQSARLKTVAYLSFLSLKIDHFCKLKTGKSIRAGICSTGPTTRSILSFLLGLYLGPP